MNRQGDKLIISTNQDKLDLPLVINFLLNSYWGKERREQDIKQSIKNSLCFGLYSNDCQIGFARVVTDYTFIAWLFDVFILPENQRNGLGAFLMNGILNYPSLVNVRKWRLSTTDAHEFYKKFGFIKTEQTEKLMERLSV
jgi:GNAT superfamily N-acetyltransferase